MEPEQNGRPQNEREWRLLEKLLLSVQDDNRKQRRWGIVFRVLTFVYLFSIFKHKSKAFALCLNGSMVFDHRSSYIF